MTSFDPLSETEQVTQLNDAGPTPPIGMTPPAILAKDAADGKRGAAWRLLYWVIESDPRAVEAIASLDDDRLARHLVEFIALGTWAGKPFVIPPPIRTAFARTQLRTLFLPRSGMNTARAERVLFSAARDSRPQMRETAVHILGIIGSRDASPILLEALKDSSPQVRLQAAKALGRVGDPRAIPPLLDALRGADEQMGSTIFSALVQLGPAAVPTLINASTSSSAWTRWNSVRALSESHDNRSLPILVNALADPDYSVAWMGAKGLQKFGKRSLVPILELLSKGNITVWLSQTSASVLSHLYHHDSTLKPYLEPLVRELRGVSYQTTTSTVAQKTLSQLAADRVVERV